MAKTFAEIKEGDNLYIIYRDLNKDYQIGEAVVTGFRDWMYEYGDRYETYGRRPQTSIQYSFGELKFARNLEYEYDKTHFTDGVEYGIDYSRIFNDGIVETFTTYDEAKELIIVQLEDFISWKKEEIQKLKEEIIKCETNLKQFK